MADAFTREVFGFEPREHPIMALLDLQDFVGVDDLEFVDILAKTWDVSGPDGADEPRGSSLERFRKLQEHGADI